MKCRIVGMIPVEVIKKRTKKERKALKVSFGNILGEALKYGYGRS